MTAVAFSEDKDHPFRELVTSNDKSIGRNLLQRGYGRGCGCECGCDCDCEKTKKKRKRQRRKRQAFKYVNEMTDYQFIADMPGSFSATVGECKAKCLLRSDCKFIAMGFVSDPGQEPADSVTSDSCYYYASGMSLQFSDKNSRILERL